MIILAQRGEDDFFYNINDHIFDPLLYNYPAPKINPKDILSSIKEFDELKYKEALFCIEYWNKIQSIDDKIDLLYSVSQLKKYMTYLTTTEIKAVLCYFKFTNNNFMIDSFDEKQMAMFSQKTQEIANFNVIIPDTLVFFKCANYNKYQEALFCIDYWNKMIDINGKIDLTYSIKQLQKYMIYLTEGDITAGLKYFECQYVSKS